jgi:hypothetical protein
VAIGDTREAKKIDALDEQRRRSGDEAIDQIDGVELERHGEPDQSGCDGSK